MALFKVFKGLQENLDSLPIHEGYAYFTKDGHNLYIDVSDTERVQVNAKYASGLSDGATTIEINDIYIKNEIDDLVAEATTTAYTTTLTVDGWVASDDMFYQDWSNTSLLCGASGTVPPIITYTSNQAEYSKIDTDKTLATAGQGIRFWIAEQPTEAIGLIITDVK